MHPLDLLPLSIPFFFFKISFSFVHLILVHEIAMPNVYIFLCLLVQAYDSH